MSLTTASSHSASPEPKLDHTNSVTLFPVLYTTFTRDVVPPSLGKLEAKGANPGEGGWEEVVGESAEHGTPGPTLQDNKRLVWYFKIIRGRRSGKRKLRAIWIQVSQ